MDSVIGIKYNGGVVIAADQMNAYSILVYQKNLDKIKELTSHSMMGVSGPNCDLVNFTEYISKNISLYELSNDGTKLSTHAQANFARNELAQALRRGPYQVNILLGGYDLPKTSPTTTTKKGSDDSDDAEATTKKEVDETTDDGSSSLYFLDYLGTLHKVNHAAQGHASYFVSSILDKEYHDNLTEEEAIKIINFCIDELHTRFLLKQDNFIIKKVDKDGVKIVSYGADPTDT